LLKLEPVRRVEVFSGVGRRRTAAEADQAVRRRDDGAGVRRSDPGRAPPTRGS
jgi:hypothetical protein